MTGIDQNSPYLQEGFNITILHFNKFRLMQTSVLICSYAALGWSLQRTWHFETVPWAIFCIILFGGLAVFAVIQMLPRRALFEAKPEGLTIRSALQTITYRWSDIENFGVTEFTPVMDGGMPDIVKGRVEGKKFYTRVGFNFSSSYAGGGLAWRNREYNQKHYGFDGFSPDDYGMDCAIGRASQPVEKTIRRITPASINRKKAKNVHRTAVNEWRSGQSILKNFYCQMTVASASHTVSSGVRDKG